MTGVPILLDLLGRRVVIVGGGTVAARRAKTFIEAGAEVVVIAPTVAPELADSGARLLLRRYQSGDLSQAWLAVTATDDQSINSAVADEAAASQIFCVRADTAAAGSARVPAILHSGELTVSVNAGDDPRRAAELRNLIAAALQTGQLVSRPVRPASAGSVALVGGGPGDPELITVRGRRLLLEADVVVTDRLAPRSLLEALDPDVEIIDCGKSAHRHNLTQDEINAVIVERAQQGKRVVRLKGGDPFVFGRGGEEVAACVASSIAVQVVPGVTSAIAAPAAAGIPVTHRGLAADFAVVSGHRDPGRAEAGWNWPELAVGPATLVVLMGMESLGSITAELIEHGRPADTPAAAIHRATLPDQRVVRSTLAGLAAEVQRAEVGAPSVVVIGAVAALGFD
ncbi:MAG TPA: uroporphyrinogen-III C-methyltransferase [Jatrophihabitans sp.]|uniref:uroporphyrinogen-III C-methyltransferase n=1 Tax=Jatrophihabitans sp. TaxID=1932789 RepID=UPI002F03A47B